MLVFYNITIDLVAMIVRCISFIRSPFTVTLSAFTVPRFRKKSIFNRYRAEKKVRHNCVSLSRTLCPALLCKKLQRESSHGPEGSQSPVSVNKKHKTDNLV